MFICTEKDSEETLNSHMFFTIHVYQSRVDKIAGKMGGNMQRNSKREYVLGMTIEQFNCSYSTRWTITPPFN